MLGCKKAEKELADEFAFDLFCSSSPVARENIPRCRREKFDPTRGCKTLSGGTTRTQFDANNCLACTVEAPEKAIDNSFTTSAALKLPPAAASIGSPVLRAIAQAGTVYASGSRAAAVLEVGSYRDAELQLLTYFSGAVQEDFSGNSQVFVEGPMTTVSGKTSKPFDAVGLRAIPRKQGGQESLPVLEFCHDTVVP